MKNVAIFKVIILLLGIGLLSGCTSTKLLDGNYSRLTYGSFPHLNSAAPSGDRLSYLGPRQTPGLSFNNLSVRGDNLLWFIKSAAIWNEASRLGFHSKREIYSEGWYVVNWMMSMNRPIGGSIPFEIKISAGENFNDNTIFNMVFWDEQNGDGLAYYVNHGEFRQRRPIYPPNGVLDYPIDKLEVHLIINIETREFYINIPGFISGEPGTFDDVPYVGTDLTQPPSLWFAYGNEIEAGRTLAIENVSIYHSRQQD